MFIELCWKKKDTKVASIHTKKNITVKEAMKIFDEKMKNDDEYVKVYLRKFSGYRYYRYRKLKGFGE